LLAQHVLQNRQDALWAGLIEVGQDRDLVDRRARCVEQCLPRLLSTLRIGHERDLRPPAQLQELLSEELGLETTVIAERSRAIAAPDEWTHSMACQNQPTITHCLPRCFAVRSASRAGFRPRGLRDRTRPAVWPTGTRARAAEPAVVRRSAPAHAS